METLLKRLLRIIEIISIVIPNHSYDLLGGESFRDFPNDEIGETDHTKND